MGVQGSMSAWQDQQLDSRSGAPENVEADWVQQTGNWNRLVSGRHSLDTERWFQGLEHRKVRQVGSNTNLAVLEQMPETEGESQDKR